ncbi:hypothetical protein Q1695_003857 [Nippostrongylus brasiliensis]|nr:hypothetical protein Q1695_003857 [Nippostrongylus brasiliensis]
MASQFSPSDDHIRNVMLFLFFSGPANQSYERSKEVYKGGAPTRTTVYNWFSKFKDGDYSMEDEARSGRPKELDLYVVRNQVEADTYQTTREVAATLGVNHTTVVRRLKSIGKVKKLGRWVPHVLTKHDMDRRVEASLSFLTLRRTHSWLGNFITGDEKGLLFHNVHRRAQWVDKGDEAEDVTKPSMHVKKVMLCIWWSVYGVE